MRETTDLAGWLDDNEPQDEQDRQDVLRAIETLSEVGNYAAARRDGRLVVRGWSGVWLLVRNEQTKASLLREIAAIDFDAEEGQGFRNVR